MSRRGNDSDTSPARHSASETGDASRQRKLASRRTQHQAEQQSLARWMSRLKRAIHAIEKRLKKVARLERDIARLEST